MPIDALSVLCAQLTRDLFAIAKFLLCTVNGFIVYLKNAAFNVRITDIECHMFYCRIQPGGPLYDAERDLLVIAKFLVSGVFELSDV